ncbi:hypothetical protein GGR30_001791 [Martelella radicis]|uniref:Uncharacterized protein n=1 Tax=Martelella radicis TaxID=1397476 RepID=A0A7W6KL68_9HYPH|nr:hypothetical protein [Martelella radicis]
MHWFSSVSGKPGAADVAFEALPAPARRTEVCGNPWFPCGPAFRRQVEMKNARVVHAPGGASIGVYFLPRAIPGQEPASVLPDIGGLFRNRSGLRSSRFHARTDVKSSSVFAEITVNRNHGLSSDAVAFQDLARVAGSPHASTKSAGSLCRDSHFDDPGSDRRAEIRGHGLSGHPP